MYMHKVFVRIWVYHKPIHLETFHAHTSTYVKDPFKRTHALGSALNRSSS